MMITEVKATSPGRLAIVSDDGRHGTFDVRPYFDSPAFRPLTEWSEFSRVRNGGYFIEWSCGADLSADTIEAKWQVRQEQQAQPMDAGL